MCSQRQANKTARVRQSAWIVSAALICLCWPGMTSAQVTLRVKAGTGTSLATGASRVGNTAPISTTGAQWTSTSLGGPLTLGTASTWALVDVQGATSDFTISGSQLTIEAGNLGGTASVGFNLPTAAGVDVTFDNAARIGGGQLWRVFPGRTLTVNGVLSSGIATNSTTFSMIAQGGGTIELNAANTFLNNTAGSWMRIDGGTTVRVNAMANGGVASPLGQASATAAQLRINGGTIDYVGTGHSTNRLFALTANSAITSNGTGALAYTGTGNIAYTTAANVASNGRILTLGGANAADNTFRPNLVDGTTGSGLTKTGTGLWIVSGTNTYTGNTTVSGGTLIVPATGGLPGWNSAGRWSVASGAALGIGNSFTDANIATLFGTGNFLSGGSFGFSTAAGNRTFSENLADRRAPTPWAFSPTEPQNFQRKWQTRPWNTGCSGNSVASATASSSTSQPRATPSGTPAWRPMIRPFPQACRSCP